MKITIEQFNKLIGVRNALYFRFKESNCICKECRNDIESSYEKINEVLSDLNEGLK